MKAYRPGWNQIVPGSYKAWTASGRVYRAVRRAKNQWRLAEFVKPWGEWTYAYIADRRTLRELRGIVEQRERDHTQVTLDEIRNNMPD